MWIRETGAAVVASQWQRVENETGIDLTPKATPQNAVGDSLFAQNQTDFCRLDAKNRRITYMLVLMTRGVTYSLEI